MFVYFKENVYVFSSKEMMSVDHLNSIPSTQWIFRPPKGHGKLRMPNAGLLDYDGNDLCSSLRQTIQYHSNPSLRPNQ